MTWFHFFLIIVVILLIPTAYAGKIGAPWVPTLSAALSSAFSLIKLGKKDVLVELGAGDGKVMLMATKRGAKTIGYELSPIMWAIAWLRTITKPSAKVLFKNFYKQILPKETTVVFAFLMPKNMPKVKEYLKKQNLPNAKYFLSYTFPLKTEEPIAVIREKHTAPLYIYDLQKIVK